MSNRPPLPTRFANPRVKEALASGTLPPVKYQILNCQGQDILVGRLKIETPTPSGHAFILRRFDTGAVSLTTMFRAAFPNAAESDEKQEVQWVKENHDLSGNNGSTKDTSITRLAGTWVNTALAAQLGEDYLLGGLIDVIVAAQPEPGATYRRSGRSSAAVSNGTTGTPKPPSAASQKPPTSTPLRSVQSPLITPRHSSPGLGQPHPAKRVRHLSPAPFPLPPPSSVPSTPALLGQSSPAKATPRRSARTKSPAPAKSSGLTFAPAMASTPAKTVRSSKTLFRREENTRTPGGSDETVVDEEVETLKVQDGVAGTELRDEDIREQKQLIEDLKAQRDTTAAQQKEKAEQAADDEQEEEEEEKEEGEEQQEEEEQSRKRAREDENAPYKFEFKEPEVGERAIVSNKRAGRFHLEPRNKSVAWGVAAFALGMSAVAYLPNFL